jgi:uncharacterized Zn-binding protein involved in type VI secretion
LVLAADFCYKSAITYPKLRCFMPADTLPELGVEMRAWIARTIGEFMIGSIVGSMALVASAQDPSSGPPGVITEGSRNTSIGGMPAARKGDAVAGEGSTAQGSPNVFINGRPAGTVGDRTSCGGIVVGSGAGVFINGKPAARTGDLTTGCPGKTP